MRFTTLDDWLSWQETLHPQAIDLGLERVRIVLGKLQPGPLPFTVITVGGTNGKGSCVTFLEAILRAAGYQTGAYTSPHLLRYNERIRVNGVEADDQSLCEVFSRIDTARGDLSLTYFEFGTLAALELFHRAGVDVAVLEVGLGGRLDAVNAVDADAALITSIDLDHTGWLGADRDSIAYEKAGIFRPDRPAICADSDPPPQLIEQAYRMGARLFRAGDDYRFTRTGTSWCWQSAESQLGNLPVPALPGEQQLSNAAAVLTTLASLQQRLPVSPGAICAGLADANLPGRFQIIPGLVEWILDVAHNPSAAAVLARNLQMRPCRGRTFAIIGLLADKDARGVIEALTNTVDTWYAVTLEGLRGRTGAELMMLLHEMGASATAVTSVRNACQAAHAAAHPGDRIIVLGSFHTVAPVLSIQPWLSDFSLPPSRET